MNESPYIRIGYYALEDVLPFVTAERTYKEYAGFKVAMDSQRYHTFLKGTECVTCGLKATFFALERFKKDDQTPEGRAHFNLYGVQGTREILFTKDHTTPRVHGGKDVLDNYKTMCSRCNKQKGHAMKAELRSKVPHTTCWLNLELPAGTVQTSKPYAALLKDLQAVNWGTKGHVGLAVQVIEGYGNDTPDQVSIVPPEGTGLFGGWTENERAQHIATVKTVLKRHSVPVKMRRMTFQELM